MSSCENEKRVTFANGVFSWFLVVFKLYKTRVSCDSWFFLRGFWPNVYCSYFFPSCHIDIYGCHSHTKTCNFRESLFFQMNFLRISVLGALSLVGCFLSVSKQTDTTDDQWPPRYDDSKSLGTRRRAVLPWDSPC